MPGGKTSGAWCLAIAARHSALPPETRSCTPAQKTSRGFTMRRMTSRGMKDEVLPGGLIGKLGELADEFLEDGAHLRIADDLGMEVHVGETSP